MTSKLPSNTKPPVTNPGVIATNPDKTRNLVGEFFFRLRRYAYDVVGILFLALSFILLLGLIFPDTIAGGVKSGVQFVRQFFGYGSIWLVILFAGVGIWLIAQRRPTRIAELTDGLLPDQKSDRLKSGVNSKIPWGRIFSLELAALTSLGILAILGGMRIERAELGLDGGIIGWGLATLLGLLLKPFGIIGIIAVGVFLTLVFFWSLFLGAGWWVKLVKRAPISHAGSNSLGIADPLPNSQGSISSSTRPEQITPRLLPKKNPTTTTVPPEYRKNFKIEPPKEEKSSLPLIRDERLPAYDLLVSEQYSRPDERVINQTAGMIEKTLSEFGIPAKVIGFRTGPTVTQFAVEPGFLEKDKNGVDGDAARQKVRVAQIASLQKDLALALAAERLRIEAPVPGRPYVGIEVPNSRTSAVHLRSILESDAFAKITSPLVIALGKDVSGQPVVADLARMPHLLVAGTTGSGKSVCIAAIAICLMMNNHPDDLRVVMIDPKMVELQRFKGFPHLFGKVETEFEKILVVLRWVVSEMDRRYKLLESSHSRNIETFNKKIQRRKEEKSLPRIVVFVDELADLMLSAPDQTEHNLVRLAQMARAVGIHLVVATQRPSTDVVTGIIKANFPARIAFNVASSIDSRVILDTVGAESLLGKGDMLFLPPEASAPIRSQGVMVTDQEIERVKSFWQKMVGGDKQVIDSPWDEMIAEEAVLADRDNLVDRAIEIVRGSQRASASMLQRRLRIGYPRAARLIEELEALGVVGPSQGGGRDREVLLSRE